MGHTKKKEDFMPQDISDTTTYNIKSLFEMDIFLWCRDGQIVIRAHFMQSQSGCIHFVAIYILRYVHCHPPMYQVTQVRDSQPLFLSKNQFLLLVPSACLLSVYYRGSAPGYALTARLHLCSPERTCKQN